MNNTTNDQFWKLVAITQDVWNNTYGTNELEPYLLDILQFVKKHITEKDDLVKCFIILLKESCGPLEIVVFCMRELQWSRFLMFTLKNGKTVIYTNIIQSDCASI